MPRIISGLVYIGLILLGTTGSQWLFAGLMALFLILCLIEFVKITEFSKLHIAIVFLVSAGVFYYFSKFLFEQQNAFVTNSLSFAGPVLFLLACFTIMFSTDELRIDFGKSTIAVAYIAVPFSLALTIPQTSFNLGKTVISSEILFIFILIWISDIMAYVVGSLWGKHKLAPKISGGKTWEGAIGGFVFTLLTGFIFYKYLFPESRMNWIIIGAIVAVFAPVGDLVESKLKRSFDVKDSGKLMPGHGGFLDRLDSFIFVIPMVYLYLLINQFL
ncbi:MAG: phosphatidate cytidylyltransferase [Moheibacter sp.]